MEKRDNDKIRGMLMQSKVAKQKSRCSICDSRKLFFFKKQNIAQKYFYLKFTGKCKSMLNYCLMCKVNTESVDSKVLNTTKW